MAAEGVEGQATVHIQAPPEKVYAMISDVTRMGEWSPETYRCEWIDGAAGPTAGARFKGSNKRGILRWSTKPTVTVADAGNEFTFEVGAPGKEDTRWSYKLTPKEGGTDLTESFESLRYTLKRVPSTRISLPSIVTRNGRASSCTTSNSASPAMSSTRRSLPWPSQRKCVRVFRYATLPSLNFTVLVSPVPVL